MGGVRYCGEVDADGLNMVEEILKQPTQYRITRGYFNIRGRLPKERVGMYDERMIKLTSESMGCLLE